MRFARIWAAGTICDLGDGVTAVAGPLVVASITGSPLLVSGVVLAQRLPWLLFGLPSGVVVDRHDRGRVMLAANGVRMVAIGALGVAVLLRTGIIPILYAVFFTLGAGETLFRTAYVSTLPAVVPDAELERANSRVVGGHMLAHDLLAAPLGGLMFALAAASPFLLDAMSFLASAALIAPIRGLRGRTAAGGPGPGSVAAELVDGLRWLARHRFLRTLTLAITLMNLTYAAATSILVLVARDRLGLGSLGYGLLFAGIAVGGIAGSAAGTRLIAGLGPCAILRTGLVIEAATNLVIALSHNAWLVAAVLVVFGAHCALWSIVSTLLRQRLAPPGMLGRVNSVYLCLSAGAMALGALAGGALSTRWGLTAPFWLGFATVACLAVATWPVFQAQPAVRPAPTPSEPA